MTSNSLMQLYMSKLETDPYKTKVATSTLIDILADITTQAYFEKKGANINVSRTLKIGSFGALRTILLHNYFFYLEKLFAGKQGTLTTLFKIVIDQSIAAPIVISFFLIYTSWWEGDTKNIQKKLSALPSILWSSVRVWGLVALINFSLIPPDLRILFGSFVGFFWTIYLSSKNEQVKKRNK